MIACLWEPNPDNVCFNGIPFDSFMRKNETEWSKRKEDRLVISLGHIRSSNTTTWLRGYGVSFLSYLKY
jgi:hypothetical protein